MVPDSGAVQDMVEPYRKYTTLEEATAAAIKAGSDLDNSAFPPAIPGALAKGLLTEEDIDQSLRRVLKVRFRLGEFDPPAMVPYTKIPATVIDSHRDLALRAARESIVLLTNKNNFLPLDKTQDQDDRGDRSARERRRTRAWAIPARHRSSSCRSMGSGTGGAG